MTRAWVICLLLCACSPAITTTNGGDDGHTIGPEPAAVTAEQIRQALSQGDLKRARELVDGQDAPERLRRVVAFLADGAGDPVAMTPVLDRELNLGMVAALRASLTPQTPGGAYVHTRHVLHATHRDPSAVDQARTLAGQVNGAHLRDALSRVATRVTSRRSGVKAKTLGVLLPLSGPYRGIGEAALRSIQLAIGKGRVRLVVKDTRGDAEAAARLVETLVHKHRVMGILGPVGAFESSAASARAAELGVPLLVLSAREEIARKGANVFRTRVTASKQGTRLARYAVSEMNIKRFGLLISDSPYGWALAGAFWDEVQRLGGEVTAAEVYGRGSTGYRGIIQRLVGGKRGRAARAGFKGLLIADDHKAVRKLIVFLPFWGVTIRRTPGSKRGVQLIGGDAWNHPTMVDQTEQITDNAVFCDSFFPDETDGRIARFVTTFYGRYREPPTAFEAEVYDAARLMQKALKRAKGAERESLAKALRTMRFRGITGLMRFDARGDVQKDVIILTVDQDAIRPRNSEREERALRRSR